MSARKPRRNGRSDSKPSVPPFKNRVLYPSAELMSALASVYDYWRDKDDPRRSANKRREFVFHMTDWLNDLEELTALYERPRAFSQAAAGQVVFGFFTHALNHLNAAARLLLEDQDLRDPFARRNQGSRRVRARTLRNTSS